MITMKFPFAKLFKKPSKAIPEVVIQQLLASFPGAKNIDWEAKNNCYEAIFYLNDAEHIAQISKRGILIEYRKNLWPAELPEKLKKAGNNYGEIMNGIFICRGTECVYEMIIRNEKLDRFEYIFNLNGEMLSSVQL